LGHLGRAGLDLGPRSACAQVRRPPEFSRRTPSGAHRPRRAIDTRGSPL